MRRFRLDPRNQRLLVYAMQSSGASLFTYFLAQIPGSVGVVDLHDRQIAPNLQTGLPSVVKAIVSTDFSFEEHCASYQPTKTLLFLRNPLDIYSSLISKSYADYGGKVKDKLASLEACFVRRHEAFSLVLRYEDFVESPERIVADLIRQGIALPDDALSFKRTRQDILDFNLQNCAWCARGFRTAWGFGNIHFDGPEILKQVRPTRNPGAEAVVEALCPNLLAHYGSS